MSAEELANYKVEVATPYQPSDEPTISEQEVPEQSENVEAKESPVDEVAKELGEDDKSKSLDELPLPEGEDEKTEGKKNWFDKKLARKQREIDQRAQEAEYYKLELERLKTQTAPNPMQGIDPGSPKRENYANDSEYFLASTAYANQQYQRRQAEEANKQAIIAIEHNFKKKWDEANQKGAEKYEDYDDVVAILNDRSFPSNRAMAEAVTESPFNSDLLYFLGKYPEKAREIALSSPVQAVKKIAEIEARFRDRQKTPSKAPRPLEPLNSNQVKAEMGGSVNDLVKNSEKMTQREFEIAVKKLNEKKQKIWA